jgi:hypothetical protein
MTIRRNHGQFTPECDGCDDILPNEADFAGAIAAMKAAGWKTTKTADEKYEHKCRECQKALPQSPTATCSQEIVNDLFKKEPESGRKDMN